MKENNMTRIDYSKTPKVLEVKNLRINFSSDTGMVYAVRGVSFDLYKGETLCIVGESGSGKSVTSKTIMGILANNAIIESGQILYEGEDLVRISEEEFHRIRGHKIGMIFQDPLSSLNPITRVGKQITEATLISKNILKKHYNDLISKQLVALRNISANAFYEKNKTNAEINKINAYLKLLKNTKVELNEEQKDEISEYINLLNNNILEDISSLEYKLESQKKVDTLENKYLEEEIKEKNIELLNEEISFYKEFKENLLKASTDEEKLSLRKDFLNHCLLHIKKTLLVLKPIYTKALVLRKVDAKKENLDYAKKVKEEYLSNINSLKDELKPIEEKIKEILPSLSETQIEVYKDILEEEKNKKKLYSRFARFFVNNSIKGHEINISKVTKKEEKSRLTGNEEFDNLVAKRSEILEKIEKTKDDYVYKTKLTEKEAKKMALEVMREVGIPLPEKRFYQYPFEFSGGMRQRIVIAIALTANPDILICDEPTTALDVTIQAQILELINRLKKERGLSCIFITHDLGVVANMADRVAVMYAGKIVEYGTAYEIFYNPKHPYTWALLSSIPDIDSKEKLEAIAGTPPDMRFPPKGDAFALRSKYALAIDFKYEPPFFKVSDTHYAATWLLHESAPKVEMPQIVKTRIANSLKQFEEKNENSEILKEIPQESFKYIDSVKKSVKQSLLQKNLKAYQQLEDGTIDVSLDDANDNLHTSKLSKDELVGVKEEDKSQEINNIKSKCKYKEEYVKDNIILSVNHLKQYFFFGSSLNRYKLKAVHDVSFNVKEGECFGIVGESGCGKTTTGRCIMRLYHITSGSIYYKGYRIAAGSRWNQKEIKYTNIRYHKKIKELKRLLKEGSIYSWEYEEEVKKAKEYRNNVVSVQKAKISQIKHDDKNVSRKLMSEIQMIFQDPIDSLDPRMTVEDIIQEGLILQGYRNKEENHKKVIEVLEKVGLIADYCNRYPHEFSGGQRQRIGIARALIMNPKLLICDEPISALDVSIRAQIINLLNKLKEEMGLTIMFIAHDLSVVKYFCDRIAVMYFGELVELASSDELFKHPLHPYTKSLLSAIPKPNPLTEKERVRIVYDPQKEHDYSLEKPSLVEITKDHFILASPSEVVKYKEEIKKLDLEAKEE